MGDMRQHTVAVTETVVTEYILFAESEEDALENYAEGVTAGIKVIDSDANVVAVDEG